MGMTENMVKQIGRTIEERGNTRSMFQVLIKSHTIMNYSAQYPKITEADALEKATRFILGAYKALGLAVPPKEA